MNYEKTLTLILDIGAGMIRSGGETHRVEDAVCRMADASGFQNLNVWVVPTNLQATVTDPEGKVLTQLRAVRGSAMDFETLASLNTLSRWLCAEKPDEEAIEARLREIQAAPRLRPVVNCMAVLLGGTAFGFFFGCDWLDSLTAVLASLLIWLLIRWLSPKEGNPLILNFTVSFFTELLILHAARFGLAHNAGNITIGVVMLLISGLTATNGLRDLVHLDTLSGLINIVAAVTGAIGIALGMALPMMLLQDWTGSQVSALHPNEGIQLIGGAAACVGFAVLFHVRGTKIFWCGLGGFLCWGAYLIAYKYLISSVFGAALIASALVGLYAQIMARVHRVPATVFTTICMLPLIPGSSLYYSIHGIVTHNAELASSKAADLGLTCFGIVLGFMVIEVVNRFLRRHPRR